ncbi:site-specific DNA-methyltransferase [Dermabacter sp. p3-SID358]|uniref:site-specific DNA-methyltransferase n=1 Tax=Dermabacter sp. p3-SID358 TaxID=2916114 RepID=UPI0021A90119|nr:DNA methyltransferase [Dermabacter sp. p3-SID358]MCT1866286.1 site-specific DNA-methyltransferase [Dermabacter sp. p3-SID358]
MLTYTHRGKVDAIYIDPPYNTGAKDWKYNNDYVEGDDAYRHSKWLAMMERRLLVAKELLNPDDSVLICTIDEKEYLRLGLLLEQTFPEARTQMISSVINPSGAARQAAFRRTDEYIFFVFVGKSAPLDLPLPAEWRVTRDKRAEKLRWDGLMRSGSNTQREDSPNQFYPIFVYEEDGEGIFHSVGKPFFGNRREFRGVPDGCCAIWPIRKDGSEGNWQISSRNAQALLSKGYLRLGRWRGSETAVTYLKKGNIDKVERGLFPILGQRKDGSIIVDETGYRSTFVTGTQWRVGSHSPEQGGTKLLTNILDGRRFPFPKSLYAVEDALRFFTKDKSEALILDFFSGSGTTAHAVMRLNKQDGGRRQCISVTNNEVSADEQKKLRKQGLRPGDPEWEALGICDYITKPRVTAAITGKTPNGEPIKGGYKFTDEFPMADGFEENAAFFTLTYESPLSVRHHRAFERVAPILWLRAGSQGRIITSLGVRGWNVSEVYAVLENFNESAEFFEALAGASGVRTVFFVTEDDAVFQMACRKLPEGVEPVRLYSSYLQNFEINRGRA